MNATYNVNNIIYKYIKKIWYLTAILGARPRVLERTNRIISLRCNSKNYKNYILWATRNVRLKPPMQYTLYTIQKKFLKQNIMIKFGLKEIITYSLFVLKAVIFSKWLGMFSKWVQSWLSADEGTPKLVYDTLHQYIISCCIAECGGALIIWLESKEHRKLFWRKLCKTTKWREFGIDC